MVSPIVGILSGLHDGLLYRRTCYNVGSAIHLQSLSGPPRGPWGVSTL